MAETDEQRAYRLFKEYSEPMADQDGYTMTVLFRLPAEKALLEAQRIAREDERRMCADFAEHYFDDIGENSYKSSGLAIARSLRSRKPRGGGK